jgi:hypothetical protein
MEVTAKVGNDEPPLVPDEDRHRSRQAVENDYSTARHFVELEQPPAPVAKTFLLIVGTMF